MSRWYGWTIAKPNNLNYKCKNALGFTLSLRVYDGVLDLTCIWDINIGLISSVQPNLQQTTVFRTLCLLIFQPSPTSDTSAPNRMRSVPTTPLRP